MLMRVNYQVIFTLGTKNLGRHTKRGSGLIVMVCLIPDLPDAIELSSDNLLQGVGGGAWFPPAAGHIADTDSTAHSYIVPFAGYVAMAIYAMYVMMCTEVSPRSATHPAFSPTAASLSTKHGKVASGSAQSTKLRRSEPNSNRRGGTAQTPTLTRREARSSLSRLDETVPTLLLHPPSTSVMISCSLYRHLLSPWLDGHVIHVVLLRM